MITLSDEIDTVNGNIWILLQVTHEQRTDLNQAPEDRPRGAYFKNDIMQIFSNCKLQIVPLLQN